MNTSIALQTRGPEIQDPVNMLARVLQVKGMQQEQSNNEFLMGEKRRGVERANKLQEILGMGGDSAALRKGGFLKESMDLDKAEADRRKDTAAAGKDEVETRAKVIGQYRDQLWNVQTPEQAAQWFQAQYQDPVIGKFAASVEPLERAIASIPRDPAQFTEWRQRAGLGMTEFIKQNKPTTTVRNTGGTTDVIQTPGLGGAAQVVSSVKNTETPDGAANRAVQIRGQNMADARQREATAATMTRPFEITGPDGNPVLVQQDKQGNIRPVQGFGPKQGASKPLTDAQAKANLFGTRMQESHRILNDLEGKYNPMAVNAKMAAAEVPGIGGAAGYAGNLMLSTEGQQAEQAQRDFINAVLRRESGAVISPAEFSNGQKQYFPQPGDTPEVLAQKRRNREIAISGMAVEVPGGFKTTPSLTNPGSKGGASGGWSIKKVD